ncbi:MAG: hypothetical protein HPY53_07565 [Brevinematales bacterium]|nr:hypothetical protein [Brevinematales bacterium]
MKKFIPIILPLIILFTTIGCGLFNELLEPGDISLLVKDTVPPVITLTSLTNNQPVGRYFTLSGNVSDVGRGVFNVWVKKDTGSFEKALVSGNNWAFQVDIGYNYAVHTYYIYAVDKATNSSAMITNAVVRVQIPSVMITNIVNGITTNLSNIVIWGVASIDSPAVITNITVRVNGGLWIQASNDSGNWTDWHYDAVLQNGYNSIIAKVYGNTPLSADSGYYFISNDTIPPVFVNVNYTNYQKVLTTPYQMRLVYQDAVAGVGDVYLKLNGGTGNPIGYSSPYWISNITENTLIAHVWNYWALDKFSQQSVTNQVTVLRKDFTVQEFVPYLNGMPTNFSIVAGGENIVISGDGNTIIAPIPGSKVMRLYWNGSAWQTNIFRPIYFPTSTCFGRSIAVSFDGKKIVIGDEDQTNFSTMRVGGVYLFEYNGTVWITNLFLPTNQGYNPGYGYCVDISADGNTILIGSPYDAEIANWAGAAHYYKKNGALWETNKFFNPGGLDSDRFGTSLSLSSDSESFVVGSYVGGSGGAKKVYYYSSTNGNWEITNVFSQSGNFSYRVKMSDDGNSFLVDVYNSTVTYYYHWNGSTWESTSITPHAYGTANTGNILSISSNGNTLIIGDAYVFRYFWNGSVWTTNIIFAYDPSMENFGQGVASSPDGKSVWVKGDKILKFTSEW